MSPTDVLERLSQSLSSAATVKSVFGEPIHAENKTVIPVARVQFGFGAGGGAKRKHSGESEPKHAEGGGGGGGMRAWPAGALEITAEGTRFIRYTDLTRMAAVLAAGALLGVLLASRR